MRRLRNPDGGCPWDRQQTFRSLVPFTIEEAYEVADSIERSAMEELPTELGDLLFQVVFYCQLAEEVRLFDWPTVVGSIVDKLTRRHPHVFGDAEVADAESQALAWERGKAAERKAASVGSNASVLDGIATTLPAISRALKLQKRAAAVNFDWSDATAVLKSVYDELEELNTAVAADSVAKVEEEFGDLLFTCVNLARFLKLDPEQALRIANRKFETRFRFIERELSRTGRDIHAVGLSVMDELWAEAKRRENARAEDPLA